MQELLECYRFQLDSPRLNADGVIQCTSQGNDPYWLLDGLNLENKYVHVRLKVSPERDDPRAYYYCKLYFLEEGQKDFDETHSLTLPIKRFGQFDNYDFRCLVFQQRKILAIRFHPFSHRGRIEVKELAYCPYAQRPRAELAELSAQIEPLLLSFFARSGSTLAMKILVRHPQITGYTVGTHEAHFLRYFSSLYDMIKTSHIYSGDHSDGTLMKRLEVLSRHYRPDCVLPKPIEFSQYIDLGIFRSYYAKFLKDFLPEMLADMNVPHLQSAEYYIEKHMDGPPFGWTKSMLELFPGMKIVMLFRDPRDVLMSFEAFRKRELINKLQGDLPEQVGSIIRHYAGRLSLYDEYPDRVFVLRYEDLLQAADEVLTPMLKFLTLDASRDTLKKMLRPLRDRDLQARRHVTAGSQKKSVGRWQQDMPLAIAEQFEAHSDVIERLGYPL